MRLWTRFS